MRAGALAAVLLAASVLPACGTRGLSFVQDERLTILRPTDRAKVELPLSLAWKVEDFRITGPTGTAEEDAGYFAVFVDRAPQPPGRTVASVAGDDPVCADRSDCPSVQDLQRLGVYTTDATSLTLNDIRDLSRDDRRDFHEVTIVLLNGKSERIGESAFRVEFEIARDEG